MQNLLLVITLLSLSAAIVTPREDEHNERLIRNYFRGFKEKDWELTRAQLDASFTFTSPAPDDHINIETFKEMCWPQSAHVKDFEFVKIVHMGDEAMAIMHCITVDEKLLRNVEYFKFRNGKIASIEVFFGGTGAGYPTNAK